MASLGTSGFFGDHRHQHVTAAVLVLCLLSPHPLLCPRVTSPMSSPCPYMSPLSCSPHVPICHHLCVPPMSPLSVPTGDPVVPKAPVIMQRGPVVPMGKSHVPKATAVAQEGPGVPRATTAMQRDLLPHVPSMFLSPPVCPHGPSCVSSHVPMSPLCPLMSPCPPKSRGHLGSHTP